MLEDAEVRYREQNENSCQDCDLRLLEKFLSNIRKLNIQSYKDLQKVRTNKK